MAQPSERARQVADRLERELGAVVPIGNEDLAEADRDSLSRGEPVGISGSLSRHPEHPGYDASASDEDIAAGERRIAEGLERAAAGEFTRRRSADDPEMVAWCRKRREWRAAGAQGPKPEMPGPVLVEDPALRASLRAEARARRHVVSRPVTRKVAPLRCGSRRRLGSARPRGRRRAGRSAGRSARGDPGPSAEGEGPSNLLALLLAPRFTFAAFQAATAQLTPSARLAVFLTLPDELQGAAYREAL